MFFWPEVILLYKILNMDIFLTSLSSLLLHIKSTSEIFSSAICSSTSELYILYMKKFQKCINNVTYIFFFIKEISISITENVTSVTGFQTYT